MASVADTVGFRGTISVGAHGLVQGELVSSGTMDVASGGTVLGMGLSAGGSLIDNGTALSLGPDLRGVGVRGRLARRRGGRRSGVERDGPRPSAARR